MAGKKGTRISSLLYRLANKVMGFGVTISAAVLIYLINSSTGTATAKMESREALIQFVGFMGPLLVTVAFFLWITKHKDMARKFEEQVFFKESRQERLSKDCAKLRVLLELPDDGLEMLVASKAKVKASLELEGMAIELPAPAEKYSGWELRAALAAENERLEKQLREITFPEKPLKYVWWERHFKLDTTHAV